MAPPFLTLDPTTSPFNLSPHLSPKSDDSEYSDTVISPLTPSPIHHQDLSRLSGFPQSSSFNFGLNDNNTSPVSPSGERRPSEGAASLILPRPTPNAVPGVYRAQNAESGEPAPPPYERYAHAPMPAGGVRASRISIVAHQFPTDPAGAAPVRGHHRFASAASIHGAPRRFSGQRQLYPLTLGDGQAPRHVNAPSNGLKSQASWRIFGSTEGLDEGSEKKSLSRKGKWGICIAVATILITVAIVGAIVGTMQPKASHNAAIQEPNLSGLPHLPVGEIIITPQADAEKPTATCVNPRTLWSCNLPSDTTFPIKSATSNIPQFIFTISLRNSTKDDLEEQVLWAPIPEQIPDAKEYSELAEVDGIQSENKAGEETNFYLSMQTDARPITISQVSLDKANQTTSETSNDGDIEEEPTTDSRRKRVTRRTLSKRLAVRNPAEMLPLKLRNQPLRLFDRGLATEHYGFYVYYNKTIRVTAPTPADVTDFTNSNDGPSGVAASVSAGVEVKWEKTRFRVAIWTKRRASGEVDLIGENGQRLAPQPDTFDNTFLYPVSVIEDRAGAKGEVSFKRKNFAAATIIPEEEKDPKGCFCEWRNWRQGVN